MCVCACWGEGYVCVGGKEVDVCVCVCWERVCVWEGRRWMSMCEGVETSHEHGTQKGKKRRENEKRWRRRRNRGGEGTALLSSHLYMYSRALKIQQLEYM